MGPDRVNRFSPRRSGPVLAAAALVASAGCVGIGHSAPTTTTLPPSPPHLVAIVTLIGPGSSAGAGSTVEAIDLSASPVTMRAYPVGQFPDAVAVTPNGRTAYVASYTADSITPIDLLTGKVGRQIPAGSGPAGIAIAPDGKTAYVTDAGSSPIGTTVTPIDLKTRTDLAPITVGAGPQGIAISPNGSMAYVANAGAVVSGQTGPIGDTVTPINLATDTAEPAVTVGNAPLGVAITADGTTAWVTNANSDSVTPIAVGPNTGGIPVAVDGSPQAVATSGETAWVASTSSAIAGGNNLSSVTSGSSATGATVALPKAPSSVAIEPGGGRAWVVASGANALVPVDLATGKVVAGTVALPGGPYAVALATVPAQSAKVLTTPPGAAKKRHAATS